MRWNGHQDPGNGSIGKNNEKDISAGTETPSLAVPKTYTRHHPSEDRFLGIFE
jgi:hypothetical protein